MSTKFFIQHFIFIIILIIFTFLLIFRLSSHMLFFSDIGWFYMQARDMLLTGNIPLVSIPSSHPWLHQGPYWTYLLGIGLFVGKFHPLSGGVIAVTISLSTLIVLYIFTRKYFGQHTALITAALYATSPLILIHARMPYHTMPIPLMTLCYLWSVVHWIQHGKKYFPLVLLSLALLYNFELATVIIGFHFFVLLILLFCFKRKMVREIWNKRTILISSLAVIIPMLPMLLYDLKHGFPQTIKFVAWLGYRAVSVLFSFGHPRATEQLGEFLQFSGTLLQRLIFQPSLLVSLVVLFLLIIFALIQCYSSIKKHKFDAKFVIFSGLLIGLGGYLGNNVTSEAYVPMLFPFILISLGIGIGVFMKSKTSMIAVIVGIVIVGVLNVKGLLIKNYFMEVENGYGATFTTRENAVKTILLQAQGKQYTIKGKGEGSKFESYLMPYTYVAWYYGNAPVKAQGKSVFVIEEKYSSVNIVKE